METQLTMIHRDSAADDTVRFSNVHECVGTPGHVKADNSATSPLSTSTVNLSGIKYICDSVHFDSIAKLLLLMALDADVCWFFYL